MSTHHTFLLVALLATPLAAQTVSVQFSPNPAPPGAVVTITGTDQRGQGLNLPSPCTWLRIHQGSQTGPIVGPNSFCPTVIVPIPPNGSFSMQWDQLDPNGRPMPPGAYWFETRVWDSGLTAIATDWFCLSVQAPPPGPPTLLAAGPAVIGQSTPISIDASGYPNGLYFVAASLHSSNPVSVLGMQTCLSEPITFVLFTNPWGSLDANGRTAGITLNIPNLPFVRFWGLQIQGLVTDNVTFQLTNPQSFTIQ